MHTDAIDTKPRTGLKATQLRLILWCVCGIIWLAGPVIFYYSYSHLHARALEIADIKTQLSSKEKELTSIGQLRKDLDNNTEAIARAAAVAADGKTYTYQDQIINDLRQFAERSEVNIRSITFEDKKPATTTVTTKDPVTGVEKTTTQAATGATKSTFATVTLTTPLNYDKFLNFIHAIENNLTKMQIARVELTRPAGTTGAAGSATAKVESNQVSVQSLQIEVYMR